MTQLGLELFQVACSRAGKKIVRSLFSLEDFLRKRCLEVGGLALAVCLMDLIQQLEIKESV